MHIFINKEQHRLRAFWRIFLHFVLTAILAIVLNIPVAILYIKKVNFIFLMLTSELSLVIAVTLITFCFRKWIDKRPFTSLGLKINYQSILDLLGGFLIAGLMMAGIFLLEKSVGLLTLNGIDRTPAISGNWIFDLFLVMLLFLLVGWAEELFSRGYQYQNMSEGLSPFWGAILSAIVFGGLHFSNPDFSWMAFVGLFLAGLFFVFAFKVTQRLWLPIGLHFGWNFFEGYFFGYQVSGLTELPRLLNQTVNGPLWATGGGFGPEAGVVLLAGLIIGVLLVIGYSKLVPPNRDQE